MTETGLLIPNGKPWIAPPKTPPPAFLDYAAERLFVEHGFEATSLRTITQQAEVNLAAVNYHFGSNTLFQAVLVSPGALNQQCVAELDVENPARRSPVEAVLMTFIRPCLALSKDPNRGGAMFVRLLSRTFVENHRLIRDTCRSNTANSSIATARRFLPRCLPGLKLEELAWRLHLAFA